MNIDFAVVCDYALIDRFGKLSVLGVFQNVWVASFPTVHPRVHLVIRLKGARTEVGEHDIKINFSDSHGKQLISGDGKVNFSEPPAGVLEVEAGAVLVFDIPLPEPGRYKFEITIDSAIRTTVPVVAAQALAPPTNGTESG